jgi:hypothetical protein
MRGRTNQRLANFSLCLRCAQERDIRLNMTGALWDAFPLDLVGSWQLVETDSASLLVNPNDLAEFNYGAGGGNRRARRPPASPAALPLAQLNAALAQASGTASSPTARRSRAAADAAVTLLAGGRVSLGARDCVGLGWRLDPGPTHLDTCCITVAAPRGALGGSAVRDFLGGGSSSSSSSSGSGSSGSSSGSSSSSTVGKEILTFMGYVDRGQRIEARFSKRPIRMSGLVSAADAQAGAPLGPRQGAAAASMPKGATASRFVMEKDRV